jgi:hypothetical protein
VDDDLSALPRGHTMSFGVADAAGAGLERSKAVLSARGIAFSSTPVPREMEGKEGAQAVGGGSPADRSAVRLHFFDPDGNGIELFAISPALDRSSHGGKLDSGGKGRLAGASLNALTFSHRSLGSCAWSEATVFYEEVLGLRRQSSQELPWRGARMLLPPCHSIYIHECGSSARRCKHPQRCAAVTLAECQPPCAAGCTHTLHAGV